MKKTTLEINKGLIELSEARIELEKKRFPLATKKKRMVQETMDIDIELGKIHSEMEINKKEITALKGQDRILKYTFNQREAERLLFRSCMILKGVVKRGIGLEADEERFIDDVENFLNGIIVK